MHAAARHLLLTQTAVTQRLQVLEAELGASLFLRSRRGMTLTESGEALARYCRLALDLEGETLAAMKAGSGPIVARVAIEGPSSILRARIIPALAPLLREMPQLVFQFRMSDTASGVSALKRGDADLVVLKREDVVEEFASRLLKPEKYVLVGPVAWAKRSLREIVANERIIDFDTTDMMTYRWLEKQGVRDLALGERHFVNNTDALASMVSMGAGYSVLALDFAKGLIERGEACILGGGKTFDFEIALAWFERKHPTAYWRKILAQIK